MKAAIAILADFPTQNIARRMVFEMSQSNEMAFLGSLLPAHVSLKQPFTFESMDRLEAWFESLAARTAPFEVALDSIYYQEFDGYGIIGFNVVETPILRALHNQINQELRAIVKDPTAPYDGAEYHFHMTIELGKIETANPYKLYFDRLPEKRVSRSFRATHLAMFFYPDRSSSTGSFIVYRVMPLGTMEASS